MLQRRLTNGLDSKTMQDYLQTKNAKEFIAELKTRNKWLFICQG